MKKNPTRDKQKKKPSPFPFSERFEDYSQQPEFIIVDGAKVSFPGALFERVQQHVDSVLSKLERQPGFTVSWSHEKVTRQITRIMAPLFLGLPPDREKIKLELRELERREEKVAYLLGENPPDHVRPGMREWLQDIRGRINFLLDQQKRANRKCELTSKVVAKILDFFWLSPVREFIALYPARLSFKQLARYIGEILNGLPGPCAACGKQHIFKTAEAVLSRDDLKGKKQWEKRGEKMHSKDEESFRELGIEPIPFTGRL